MKTYRTVKELLEDCLGNSGDDDAAVDAEVAKKKGHRGGASTDASAAVTFRSGKTRQVFIKICTRDSVAWKYDVLLNTFNKEVGFYTGILPEMVEFIGKENMGMLAPYLPVYLGHAAVEELDGKCIIFEDFATNGFKVSPQGTYHTDGQVIRCMEAIAQFHAIAYTISTTTKKGWLEKYSDILQDLLPTEAMVKPLAPLFCHLAREHMKILRNVLKERPDEVAIPEGICVEDLDLPSVMKT